MPDDLRRMLLVSEIASLRRLVTLSSVIITLLVLVNMGAHAYRIYLIEAKLNPMQRELDILHKELDYDCKHKGTDSSIQCRLRSPNQRFVDQHNDQ